MPSSTRVRRSKMLISHPRPDVSLTDRVTAGGRIKEFFGVWLANRERMETIDKWSRCELDEDMLPVLPDEATDEFRRLRETSPTPFGRLIVASVTQNAIVDDVRMSDASQSAPAWDLWTRNGMTAKQVPLIESAATYGQAFNLVLPAEGRLDGKPTAAFMAYSGMSALGFYTTPSDEYPEFFLEGVPIQTKDGERKWRLSFVDDRARYFFVCDYDGSHLQESAPAQLHAMDLCPVVRYYNSIDLEGRVTGEIAPVINVLARLDQDTQDRLVVQRFGAWAVRTIAGMKKPSKEDQAAARIALGVGDLLVSEDYQTKFGSLPPTPMQGHLEARRDDVRDLAATSQTPSYHLLGLSDNVGAEGLAAAEATHMRKTDIRKLGWDDSHMRTLRLGGQAMGNPEIANDYSSRCHWVQTRTEAFQSLAQALGSLQAAGIPIEMLVSRLPDWSQADTEELKKAIQEREAKEMQDAEMAAARQVEVGTALAKAKGASGGDAGAAAR